MDTTPRLRWDGSDRLLRDSGCGHVAMDNVARAFWQSRCGLREPPELTDIRALAREIREGSRSLQEVRLTSHAVDAPGFVPAWSHPTLQGRWLQVA
jgi:hypothetical protein